MSASRGALAIALLVAACDAPRTPRPVTPATAPRAAVEERTETPPAPAEADVAPPVSARCDDVTILHRRAYTPFTAREIGLPIPEGGVPLDAIEALARQLGVSPDAFECDDPCALSAGGLVVHVAAASPGGCARGVVRTWVGWESAIGIWVPVATRYALVEVDPASASGVRVLEGGLAEDDPRVVRGAIAGDLDGDGLDEAIHVALDRDEVCLGYTYDTNECLGCGVPSAEVVGVRGARGILATIPFGGRVSTPRLESALARLTRGNEPLEVCPSRSPAWTGLRPRGGPVARPAAEGFVVDLVVERVRCTAYCVTPLGDVCTTEPDPDYEVSSERCVSEGVFLESHHVRGRTFTRTERALGADGVVSIVRAEGCDASCVWRFGRFDVGVVERAPRRMEVPVGACRVERTGEHLALPVGLWAIQLTRNGVVEGWQLTVDAQTGDVTLPR